MRWNDKIIYNSIKRKKKEVYVIRISESIKK